MWTDRPPPLLAPAFPHLLEHAGRGAQDKGEHIAGLLREAKQDAAVISDPASIAWLLNIRGGDTPFTPFALGFALVHADGGTELFMDPAKLSEATCAWLGNAVSVAGREALEPALARLSRKRVRVDPAGQGNRTWNSLDTGIVLARLGNDGFYPSAREPRRWRTPWISLSRAGRAWRIREPAMPVCMTSTSF
ncbi:MAG TPA: aminopeptidase P family N-terminal domain-containing protein [Acetobacteraceae bacterium]|nr:aminopeptidase P family N-terminal domain-containing protein [Acetobacteraceae bacterium]